MAVSLEQARALQSEQAKRQAHKDIGLEYHARALVPPSEDKELQDIIAREREFQRDDRVSARTVMIDKHLADIDQQIDKLICETEITDLIIYELGFLTLLRFYHLERIEIGDHNPLARDLLRFYHKLR